MGKNNRARRAAKAKARKNHRSPRPGFEADPRPGAANPFQHADGSWPFRPPPPTRPGPEERWRVMESEAHRGDLPAVEMLARLMVRDDAVRGPRVAEQMLQSYVDQLWRCGWQPAELVRQARRLATVAAAQIVELAIIADHEGRTGQALDPRWAAQLRELTQRNVRTRDGWLEHWRRTRGHEEAWALVQVARAMAALGHLPILETLIPPPGRPHDAVGGVPPAPETDDPVLRRVRKLLTKAESTTYDDEAASLTAKAHELMTKHTIDQALLDGGGPVEQPRTMRVPIDAPYADGKSYLLQVVAAGSRCRAIRHDGLDLSSVVGHPDDLRGVDLLFTSLLVQAQHSLAWADGGAGTRTRSQSYRSAFYRSYAARIGERLAAATEDVLVEAGTGAHLPVLAAREQSVDAAFDDLFGATVTSSAVRGGYDAMGAHHGRRAADDARFGSDVIAG